MAKKGADLFGTAVSDFYKSNGVDCTVYNDGPTMTRQEFADECDINTIMARYEKTGMLPGPNVEPMYVDFTQKPDGLMNTMQFLDVVQAEFMRLPANVRKEFENNAYAFVDFASDPQNLDQMREWGLAAPKEVRGAAGAAVPEPPAPPPASASSAPAEPPKAS